MDEEQRRLPTSSADRQAWYDRVRLEDVRQTALLGSVRVLGTVGKTERVAMMP